MRGMLSILALVAGIGSAQTARRQGEEPAAFSFSSEMLEAHNTVRERVGVAPLRWSARLEKSAQDWAEALVSRNQFAHRPNLKYGQNLFMSTAPQSAESVVKAWAAEARDYDYRTNRCHGMCAHYTQVVWAGTREVGCGEGRGPRREVWVCEYDPPGNWVGRRPY
jgi:uncharacterized protein YkwD